LAVAGRSQSQSFNVVKDPRLGTTLAELQETFDLSVMIRDRITEMQVAVARAVVRLEELDRIILRSGDSETGREAQRMKAELEEAVGELYKHGERGDHAHLHPELTTDYAHVYTMIDDSDHRPPASAYLRLEELEREFAEHMGRVRELLERLIS
jgi:hypothetical protein